MDGQRRNHEGCVRKISTSVYFDQDVLKRLQDISAVSGVSQAEIIRISVLSGISAMEESEELQNLVKTAKLRAREAIADRARVQMLGLRDQKREPA
jgi:hypothetical protein